MWLSVKYEWSADYKDVLPFRFCTGVFLAVQSQVIGQSQQIERFGMVHIHIFRDIIKGDTFHPADGVGKVFVNDIFADAHRLKDLGTLIGLQSGNTHLGGNLHDTVQHCVIVIIHGRIIVFFSRPSWMSFLIPNCAMYGLMAQAP